MKTTNRIKIDREYQPWQKDSSHIDTNKVQYWRNDIMITAQMTKEHAKELVDSGRAIVITGQAIQSLV